MTKRPLCIYHNNCADGFSAAWAVWKAFPDWEFLGANYGEPPPPFAFTRDRLVVIVDFSYKRAILEEIAKDAKAVLVLDHHKTAEEDLQGFRTAEGHNINTYLEGLDLGEHRGITTIFNMERSGGMITWYFFHPHSTVPNLLNYIQDRDLWKFNMQGSREVNAGLFSYPYRFDVWDELMRDPSVVGLYEAGVAIERKHHKDIEELVKTGIFYMLIGGYNVPVANLPGTMASDAGHLMAERAPFAATFMKVGQFTRFSLRSVEGGIDVSEIAKMYGGGGHKHAAGFELQIPISLVLDPTHTRKGTPL